MGQDRLSGLALIQCLYIFIIIIVTDNVDLYFYTFEFRLERTSKVGKYDRVLN